MLRPVEDEELLAYFTQAARAFSGTVPPPDEVALRASILERDRTLGVFEDGRLVGTAATESVLLTVPGAGQVRAAGLARISVLPTHRRRGILGAIMRRQLDDARERGEPVAALVASEGAIYGRYGFGVATYDCKARIAHHRGHFRTRPSLDGLRLEEFGEALEAMLGVVDRVTPTIVGAVRRSDAWWRWAASSPPPGDRPWEVVLRAEGDGFAAYERIRTSTLPTLDGGELAVHWLLAETPAAYAALWRYCLDVDLMDEVRAEHRSADEPLRHLLADPRALETTVWDGLWVRLVEAEAALGSRSYADGRPVRLRLEDALCPWNSATYEVGEAGCRRVDGAADLALGAEALGACYLGGNRFTTLARAGLVEELVAGALGRADVLFASPVAPWCPFRF
jgi:predicted acetyltransferase